MSTLAVDAIVDSSNGNTTTINGATPTAYNTMGKNLIINGAMQIAQRGTNVTGITASSDYRTCDRVKVYINTLGTWTVDQSTDAPNGFSNSFKITCTTADASPVGGDYVFIGQFLEAQTLQQLAYGSSGAVNMVLSFWVKSNKTGTGTINIKQTDNSNKQISPTYTINSADTWEYKTITIPADTAGLINNDNGTGMDIAWWLNSGSNYTGGTNETSWTAYDATDRNASNIGIGGSTSDYFAITGVQLEVGSVATEFERRPFGTELQLCQRYFQKIGSNGGRFVSTGSVWSGNSSRTTIPLVTTMRSQPSATFVTAASTWTLNNGVNAGTCSSLTLDSSTPEVIWINAVTAAGLGGGTCALWYETANPGAAVIHFSAEL